MGSVCLIMCVGCGSYGYDNRAFRALEILDFVIWPDSSVFCGHPALECYMLPKQE